MAEDTVAQLTVEEAEQLARIESDRDALAAVIEDLAGRSRRKRQLSARVVLLLAEREADLLVPYLPDLIDALSHPEAQTRWEILDALSLMVDGHAKDIAEAFDGAETALFDELSSTLRLSAFRFLCVWGATALDCSQKVWPILDEAIQCYHGDPEYREMLGFLHEFAQGQIDATVASELAGRLQFDAENGKGSYLKARSSEIYHLLVERFKLENPQKRARTAVVSHDDDEE